MKTKCYVAIMNSKFPQQIKDANASKGIMVIYMYITLQDDNCYILSHTLALITEITHRQTG